jgi:hypothetical protein
MRRLRPLFVLLGLVTVAVSTTGCVAYPGRYHYHHHHYRRW